MLLRVEGKHGILSVRLSCLFVVRVHLVLLLSLQQFGEEGVGLGQVKYAAGPGGTRGVTQVHGTAMRIPPVGLRG